jgi:hypothetical protein
MISYTPVPFEFREILDEKSLGKVRGKIFFFNDNDVFDCAEGFIHHIEERIDGKFVMMSTGERIRIDRIITLFGKPGPAFDEYDAFGNQCLDCKGGYEL